MASSRNQGAINRHRRLEIELEELQNDPPPYCAAGPLSDDIFHWQGVITGPPDTAYRDGVFFLDIQLPADYPYKPPQIKFTTPIYHCNVRPDGGICLDILGTCQWSPALSISSVLISICSLLIDPEEEHENAWASSRNLHGLDSMGSDDERQRLFKYCRERYDANAREWTRKYAI